MLENVNVKNASPFKAILDVDKTIALSSAKKGLELTPSQMPTAQINDTEITEAVAHHQAIQKFTDDPNDNVSEAASSALQ